MFQVRMHGRGGQGVVTAAEMLSIAAFMEKKYAQAFPSFGSERMGAPVVSFCRISDTPIRLREPIDEPDAVVIQDATLIGTVDVFGGLKVGGLAILNSSKQAEEIDNIPSNIKLITVPASDIAVKYVGRPIPNAVLLGSFAAISKTILIDSFYEAIKQKFKGEICDKNIAAAQAAYEATYQKMEGLC